MYNHSVDASSRLRMIGNLHSPIYVCQRPGRVLNQCSFGAQLRPPMPIATIALLATRKANHSNSRSISSIQDRDRMADTGIFGRDDRDLARALE